MTKKTVVIVLFVIALGALSFYFNRDRFAKDPLDVSHRVIEPRGWMTRGAMAKAPTKPIVFLFNKTSRLKSVKVVLVSDATTNKYPHAIWNLITESNSVPIKEFVYGAGIGGMKPPVKGVGAEPLQPGETYRLLVESDSEKAQHDFTPVPRTQ
jgi:hypothetical protein